MTEITTGEKRARFEIFRGRDARSYMEAPVMYVEEMPPVAVEAMAELQAAGYDEGHEVKLLFEAPGMSLTRVWFKSGFPLPRHSHNVDCVYYVTAGSLRIGTEELGPGDGFFIAEDAPYTYVAGEHGVEVLEFRTGNHFDIKILADSPAYWSKAMERVRALSPGWASEPRPTTGPGPA